MITRSQKWNDYCKENDTDTLYLASPDRSRLCIIAEGSGDNLEAEDEEEGYVDYFNIEVYDKNADCFGECGSLSSEAAIGSFPQQSWCGGGFLMLEELISDKNPTLQEILEMAKEFDDECFEPDACEILSVEEGEELMEEFEERTAEQYRSLSDR